MFSLLGGGGYMSGRGFSWVYVGWGGGFLCQFMGMVGQESEKVPRLRCLRVQKL